MPIQAIDHVQIAMPAGGEEKARAFYGGLLGLTEVEKPANLKPNGGVWFRQDGLHLDLGVDPDFRPAKKAHVGLLVTGLNDLEAALRDAGHEVVPGAPIPDCRRIFIFDPFGNRLELLERPSPA